MPSYTIRTALSEHCQTPHFPSNTNQKEKCSPPHHPTYKSKPTTIKQTTLVPSNDRLRLTVLVDQHAYTDATHVEAVQEVLNAVLCIMVNAMRLSLIHI